MMLPTALSMEDAWRVAALSLYSQAQHAAIAWSGDPQERSERREAARAALEQAEKLVEHATLAPCAWGGCTEPECYLGAGYCREHRP